MQQRKDTSELILRTVRRILRESGLKAARRFLDSRGGLTRWEAASREVARAFRATAQPSQHGNRYKSTGSRLHQNCQSLVVL